MAEEDPREVAVAKRLDQNRRARNITQRDLARAVGASQSQISKMLRGARPISLGQYFKACDALDVGPATLLEDPS